MTSESKEEQEETLMSTLDEDEVTKIYLAMGDLIGSDNGDEWVAALMRVVATTSGMSMQEGTVGPDQIHQTSFITQHNGEATMVHVVTDLQITSSYLTLCGTTHLQEGSCLPVVINRQQYNKSVEVMSGLDGPESGGEGPSEVVH